MEGYGVITSDDCNFGTVTEVRGENLIVEHGTLRKARYAIPTTFATADDAEQAVRLSVSKEIIEDSPKVTDEVDEQAVAEHYGLAGGVAEPETEGYGEVLPDDPARSAEQDQVRAGLESGPQQAARIREEIDADTSGGPPGSSPGLLGDRLGGR